MSKQTYAEKLRDPRWQKRRLEIMNRDGFACKKCGDKQTTLNVHHLYYTYGKDPWDYPEDVLVTLCEPCHTREHEYQALSHSIYLAGKITKSGWRESLVDGLRSARIGSCGDPEEGDPHPDILPYSIFGKHHYTGPFFVACDHGCFHGPKTHGVTPGPDFDVSYDVWKLRLQTWSRCRKGIEACDILFAWIDSTDCYGTLAEIGYAYGIGKHVGIYYDQSVDLSELWLAMQFCTGASAPANSPEDGLEKCIRAYQEYTLELT